MKAIRDFTRMRLVAQTKQDLDVLDQVAEMLKSKGYLSEPLIIKGDEEEKPKSKKG